MTTQAQDTVLKTLYDTAVGYKLLKNRAFVCNTPHIRIVIKANGDYAGAESVEGKMAEQLELPRRVFEAKDSQQARFLTEKTERVLNPKHKQHQFYRQQIEEAIRITHDAGLKSVMKFLGKLNATLRKRILVDIQKCSKSIREITFALYNRSGNKSLLAPAVKQWWRKEFERQIKLRFDDCEKMTCQITGKKDTIPNCSPLPRKGYGAIVSANATAFTYSGYDGLASSHIGLDAAMSIALALDCIMTNNLVCGKEREESKYSVDDTKSVLGWFPKPFADADKDEQTKNRIKAMIDHRSRKDLKPEFRRSLIEWYKSQAGTEWDLPEKFRNVIERLIPEHRQSLIEWCQSQIGTNLPKSLKEEIENLTPESRRSLIQWLKSQAGAEWQYNKSGCQYRRPVIEKDIRLPKKPDKQSTQKYCAMLVEKNMGRLAIQEILYLTVDELLTNISKWGNDLEIEIVRKKKKTEKKNDISENNGRLPMSLIRAMYLFADVDYDKKIPSHVARMVCRAFFGGRAIPAQYLYELNRRCINALITEKYPGDIVSLLKMVLIRRSRNMPTKWNVEKAEQSPSFALGSLLFVVALAQDSRNKGRKSIVHGRYLRRCCTNPTQITESLAAYFDIYIKRMTAEGSGDYAYLLQRAFDYLMTAIGSWPSSMTHEDTAEVVTGYCLMREAVQSSKLKDLFPHLGKNGKKENEVDEIDEIQTDDDRMDQTETQMVGRNRKAATKKTKKSSKKKTVCV